MASETVKRVSLELGGKSALVILPDADLDKAVKIGLANCFINGGQTCTAWTRMLVPASRRPGVPAYRVRAYRVRAFRVRLVCHRSHLPVRCAPTLIMVGRRTMIKVGGTSHAGAWRGPRRRATPRCA